MHMGANPELKRKDRIGTLLVLAACAWVLPHLFFGLTYSLSDSYMFRQTQTAISVASMLKGGPWLAYETPVLGPPWAIPFEFPLFQWIVALLVKAGLQMEMSGRLVSLGFFAGCLVLWHRGLGLWGCSSRMRTLTTAFIAMAPTYLFWSRTFLIESTALFFTLLFLCGWSKWVQRGRWNDWAWMLAGGVLAGLVKVTTLVGPMVVVGVWSLVLFYRRWKDDRAVPLKGLGQLAGAFLVILAVIQAWVSWTDGLKLQVPLAADFLTSHALSRWNFGPLAQRWDGQFWDMVRRRMLRDAVGHPALVVLAAGGLFFVEKTVRIAAALASAMFLTTLLVFSNLHFVHTYYQYAINLFVVFGCVAVFAGLTEAEGRVRQAVGVVLLMALAVAMAQREAHWFAFQQNTGEGVLGLARVVREATPADGVLAVYGLDWSAELPFYAQRRAVMLRAGPEYGLGDLRVQRTLQLLQQRGERITTVVDCERGGAPGRGKEMADYLGLRQRTDSGRCAIFR
jgi:hypothetical protein